MKKFNLFDRELFGKSPIDLIRENIPLRSTLDQKAGSKIDYLTIGDVRVKSFHSGVHQIYAGKGKNHNLVLTLVDRRTSDQKIEEAGYEKIDSCLVRQEGENADFSELNLMLSRYLPNIPVVRLQQINENNFLKSDKTFIASLFYTQVEVKNGSK